MDNPPKINTEQSVLAVEAAYDKAWQEGRVEGILDCLTKDAVLISPRGDVASGHLEIRQLLSGFLSGDARGTTHSGRVIRVIFLTDDVAVVDGEALIEGGNFNSSNSSAYARHRFTDILVRNNDRWLISQIRACNC